MKWMITSLTVTAALLPTTASAQVGLKESTVSGKPKRTTVGGPPTLPSPVELIVTYPGIPGADSMVLMSLLGNFKCTPPQGSYPFYVCRLAAPAGVLTALTARWQRPIQVGAGTAATTGWTMILGGQWGGDCSGTVGSQCQLQMTQTRKVSINPTGVVGKP